MRIARRLRQLLRKKGYRVTRAVREGLTELVATLYEENPDLSDPDAGGEEEDGDAAIELAQNRTITCPHCGEPTEVAIDLSGDDQDGVQDCMVCCSPIRVAYTVRDGRLGSFSTEAS